MTRISKNFFRHILTVSFILMGISTLCLSSSSDLSKFYKAEAGALTAATQAQIKFYNGNNIEIGSWRGFPLDRVERGENFRVSVSANYYPIRILVQADNGFRQDVTSRTAFEFSNRVPKDPSFDNVTVYVYNHYGHKIAERRLPIGRK